MSGQKCDEEESKVVDANLFVNSHVIKLCFSDSFGGTASDDAIALKYTIDYPRIELHPYDTQRFTVFYSDEKVDAKYCFNKCIQMKALSRQSRDLIALAIKCFSAHTYYVNSKIISNLNQEAKGAKVAQESTVSSVLLELEFVKRELYNQIKVVKGLETDKQKLKEDLIEMEKEISRTIESYTSIFTSSEKDDLRDSIKLQNEIKVMQK
mmetsp:Transcript_23192/g.17620  ORF Transcript_23192/g.17620 Transcript_23192/m.17620 type:complete len:209 (+) Transcript_23192:489-1115(+)|eukprot:CAMPEP_0202958688 /NCGR_PEP_ID=MMETSP1396-20130829/2966_1 /ASSEMBLY_ACC=CAM_ASM_000872 /TAXON_ID= /ORGANISM="Pseudokeronopsis sp., Strain Brazil" /LENGTH=208 /DNA_ID=CAMNT_0049676871 /DNA_START=343 /DNA_END=969 /DNA_ORIENTATION=-